MFVWVTERPRLASFHPFFVLSPALLSFTFCLDAKSNKKVRQTGSSALCRASPSIYDAPYLLFFDTTRDTIINAGSGFEY